MNTTTRLDAFDQTTWDEGERRYFKIVDDALAQGANLPISNGKPQHAVYLLAKFLDNAAESLCMFSGSLSRHIGEGAVAAFADPHVLALARRFLQRKDTTLRVVLENPLDTEPGVAKPEGHPLVAAAGELERHGQLGGSLEIRQAEERAVKALHRFDFPFHWMVMDSKAYRLELEPAATKAVANFGDPERARGLDRLFHVLHRWSSPLVTIGG